MTLVVVAETLFPGESRVGGIPCLAEEQRISSDQAINQTNRQSQPDSPFNNGPFCYQRQWIFSFALGVAASRQETKWRHNGVLKRDQPQIGLCDAYRPTGIADENVKIGPGFSPSPENHSTSPHGCSDGSGSPTGDTKNKHIIESCLVLTSLR